MNERLPGAPEKAEGKDGQRMNDRSEGLASLRNTIYAALDRRDFPAARQAITRLLPQREAEALGLLASAGIESGDAAEAEEAVKKLRRVAPGDAYTRFLAARVKFMRGETVAPARELAALAREKNIPLAYQEKIYNLLGQCCRFLGRSEESVAAYLAASWAAAEPRLAALEYSDYLFNAHYLPPPSPAERRRRAAGYSVFFKDVTPFLHRWREPEKKLRIGYISPDFRDHVVLRFCAALLTSYDQARFEVYAYMNAPEDEKSRALAREVDGWRNIFGASPAAAARQIYEDGVDILVDLAGHTRGGALPVLAYKPAPVQVSGIGYFASTGLPAVDYFLGDVYLDDAAEQDAFTEKLLVLPHSHFCYAPRGQEPAVVSPPCEKNGYVTFGSFNNFTKVTDEVLAAWAEILRQVPDSRLLLKADVFGAADSRAYAMERIARAGIVPERLTLRSLSREYLGEYADMDIALDPFPYPGGGTTCDALYMGVPVVTLAGADHGGRFGVSLLKNIGLGELAADSTAQYVEKAAGLAGDRELLAALRRELRPLMKKSPLMDIPAYMKAIESAYRQIWENYCARQAAPDYAASRRLKALSDALAQAGDTTQALAAADYILAARPANRPLIEKLAVRYLDAGEAAGAAAAVKQLKVTEKPYGFGLFLAASVAFLSGEREKAKSLAEEALERPDLEHWQRGAAHHLLAEIYKKAGDRAAAAEAYLASSQNKEIENGKLADYSNYLLNLHFNERPPEELLTAARGYGALLAKETTYSHPTERRRHDRLRVGYISPDLCRHVVAGFSQALFHDYDRKRFAVYGYANCAEDEVSRDFARAADGWRNIRGMDPKEAAQLVYEDEIDILFDLAGHTGGNLLPVLAYRPAPVQITGIGYFATTGLSAVDYFLTDEAAALPGEEAFFTERLLRLSHSHLCYAAIDGAARPVSPLPCRAAGYVTFGSLNQFDKVTDEILDAWAEILRQVPDARLLLKGSAFDDEERRGDIEKRLTAHGLPLARVTREGYAADYYAAYDRIDIALDSYPYPGGGTTCDALYRGVPVVTRCGAHHHERFGFSLLKNLGLEELAAPTLETYIAKAVALARDEELLAALRSGLRGRMQASPVMDGAAYMRELEAGYERIWDERWQK